MLPAQDWDCRYILPSMTLNKNKTWVLRIKIGFLCLHSKQALHLLNYLPRAIHTPMTSLPQAGRVEKGWMGTGMQLDRRNRAIVFAHSLQSRDDSN